MNLTAADCSGSSECKIGHLIFGSHWNRWHVDYCIIGQSADCVAELGSWIGYGVVYSAYLKRATPQNIVIGGLFGAAPPLFGWTAVTNQIDVGGVLLVMIIFTWTPLISGPLRWTVKKNIQR